jgi:hypothetical protein
VTAIVSFEQLKKGNNAVGKYGNYLSRCTPLGSVEVTWNNIGLANRWRSAGDPRFCGSLARNRCLGW